MTGRTGVRHCAVYTRKSSEEGLEQAFNSLDAQREACEAYIRSQVAEGWKPVRTRYDDGGHSGGSMERPALRQLLADIAARRINIVVVYKVDRLTRSLSDFARIVDILDDHDVSFVSVTQQFNTTTSMGRLTLNMLLSFAQFEREVTAERIRDKIAASKQKGMWMGGHVPLGFEPDGRTLRIVEAEAETVRTLFRLYIEHGTVRLVKQAADRLGLTTKVRTGANGRKTGGLSFSRGHIYRLLGNPLYIGRIAHKGETYDGLHGAIVSEETWTAVQTGLAGNARARLEGVRASAPGPLMGKLFDERDMPLTPSHAVKSGRRYRYYVSRDLLHGSDRHACDAKTKGWRLPAREIERIVSEATRALLSDHAALAHAARDTGLEADSVPDLLHAATRYRGDILHLVERVDLGADGIIIALDLAGLCREHLGTEHGVTMPGLTVEHRVAMQTRRRGVEMRLVLEDQASPARIHNRDQPLIRAVVRAHKWIDDLASGRVRSVGEIAATEKTSQRYVSRLMPLAFLAPDITEAILAGTQPAHLSVEKLTRHMTLPHDWAKQKEALGFH